MPYVSDKQRKFFHAAEERGDISKKIVDEFDKASKGKELPEYAPSERFSKLRKTLKGIK